MTRIFVYMLLSLPLVGAYALFSLGIVVTYRASRVLNLAHGAMAMLPAYVAYSLAKAGVPAPLLVVAGLAVGAILGIAVERFVLRPLRNQSQTTQTVGTVAVLGVVVAVVAKVWGTAPLNAPGIFPQGSWKVGNSVLQYGEVGLFVVALAIAGLVAALFRFTGVGLAMRAAAQNRRAAALMGIDPDRTTAGAWAMAGALAGISGVLLAAVTNLHPYTLPRQVLPAFVAALIGGIDSIAGALIGAAIVGLAQGLIPALGSFGAQAGSPQVVLAIVALVVMAVRGKRHGAAVDAGSSGAGGWRSSRRRLPLWTWAALTPVVIAWPWLPLPDSIRGDANLAAIYVVVAVSLVMLTGWVGQISLAQASFVGVSAFVTGLLARSLHVPFPLNLPLAAGAAALAACALGFVALRVRGLYLAVATLIFGWMADAYLFKAPWFVGEGGSSTIGDVVLGRPGTVPSFDLSDRRAFWYVAAAAAAIALVAAANLRDSKTGRALFTIRGSETAAASLGVNVTRMKLFAFGFSGLLAGVAGNLIMIDARTARGDQFAFTWSLFYLAIAAVGGLGSLGGAVAASVVFAGLNEVFFRVQALNGFLEVVASGLLMAAVLLRGERARAMLSRLFGRATVSRQDAVEITDSNRFAIGDAPAAGEEVILDVAGVTVQFGGLVAVSSASLDVREREIVGLIGPNGAGKTTLFNAVSGLNSPARGSVTLFGEDVTTLDVHERAARGLGRTFQVLQLVPEATVFDNVLVGTHLHSRTGPISHVFVTGKAVKAERDARERVAWALELVGLQNLATAKAGDLPFGVLRMVEIARAVVTDARLILLDEPASGLDERETDRLGDLLFSIRGSLGTSLLVVEHDVRFVTRMCDRLFVLDRGHIISSGPAAQVRSDPAVVAAYLGGGAEEKTTEPSLVSA